MKSSVLLISLLTSISALFGQDGYDWGSDVVGAKNKFANVKLNYNTAQYKDAMPRIQWLVANAPNLHLDLYIMAAQVYKRAVEESSDSLSTIRYQDSTLFFYKEQINRFKNIEAYNYLGDVAYTYLNKRPNSWDTLASIYQKIIDVHQANVFPENLYYYFVVYCAQKQLGKISDLQYIAIYQKFKEINTKHKVINASNAQELNYVEMSGKKAKQLFGKYVSLSCANIGIIYPTAELTIETAKEAKTLLEASSCIDSAQYIKVIEFLEKAEPTTANKLVLADFYYSHNNKPSAVAIYETEYERTSSTTQGQVAYTLMVHYANANNRDRAKRYALSAIQNQYQIAKAAQVIGDLYLSSASECKVSNDILTSRAVYIAAYNYYKMAGNSSKMAQCKALFPSKEELFVASKSVGATINTGCWINENVVLQTR
jgi:hypothetical protein